jgi:hypothetical protein
VSAPDGTSPVFSSSSANPIRRCLSERAARNQRGFFDSFGRAVGALHDEFHVPTVLGAMAYAAILPWKIVLKPLWISASRAHLKTYERLLLQAADLWDHGKHEEAFGSMQKVYEAGLKAVPRSFVVEPYGRFGGSQGHFLLEEALYFCAGQLGKWAFILEMADRWLQSATAADWLARKAQALVELGRKKEAIELILAHRTEIKREPDAERYCEGVLAQQRQ